MQGLWTNNKISNPMESKFITRSQHPYCPYIPANAKKLIVGSIPPYRFCINKPDELREGDVNFYYGADDNEFWKLISEVLNVRLDFSNTETAIKQRKDLLDKFNIGITDLVQSCIHKNQKSSDRDLEILQVKHLRDVLEEHPSIEALLPTSQFVKSLIGKENETEYRVINKECREYQISFNGRKYYKVILLYSPSRRVCNPVTVNKRFAQYEKVFGKQ